MDAPISAPVDSLRPYSRQAMLEHSLAAADVSTAIFTRLYPVAARLAAVHADACRSAGVEPASPLAGLPVSIKDLLDVAGEPTMAGSVVLADSAPADRDAPVVARLRAAGAAIMGKTDMTEFAYSGVGLNPHYGTPANPADAACARIPGGSSSGAAVSVAAGMCVAGIGSDTGGSIRIPAALCGLVGFKPTARRVPTAGAIPLSTTLDTICAITRSVADCILVDRIIASDVLQIPDLRLAGLRLAVPQTLMLDGLDTHVAATFAGALTRLSSAGARVIECVLPELAEYVAFGFFSSAEAYAWHRELLATRAAGYDARVAKRIQHGATISAAEYIDLRAARDAWIARMEILLAPFDALILPTVPVVAPPIAELEASDEVFFRTNSLLLRNTAAFNLLDGCAVSLPCHAIGTLPVGLMVAGPKMADARILAVAHAIESTLGGSWLK
ncbi:MAG: amidase [Burkholderiaceae bacterium]